MAVLRLGARALGQRVLRNIGRGLGIEDQSGNIQKDDDSKEEDHKKSLFERVKEKSKENMSALIADILSRSVRRSAEALSDAEKKEQLDEIDENYAQAGVAVTDDNKNKEEVWREYKERKAEEDAENRQRLAGEFRERMGKASKTGMVSKGVGSLVGAFLGGGGVNPEVFGSPSRFGDALKSMLSEKALATKQDAYTQYETEHRKMLDRELQRYQMTPGLTAAQREYYSNKAMERFHDDMRRAQRLIEQRSDIGQQSDFDVKNVKPHAGMIARIMRNDSIELSDEDWKVMEEVDPYELACAIMELGSPYTANELEFLHDRAKEVTGSDYDYNIEDAGIWSPETLRGYRMWIKNSNYTYKPEATEIDPSIDPNEEHIGPMAQEIEKVNPACVNELEDGTLTVDTNRLSLMNAGAIGDLARENLMQHKAIAALAKQIADMKVGA